MSEADAAHSSEPGYVIYCKQSQGLKADIPYLQEIGITGMSGPTPDLKIYPWNDWLATMDKVGAKNGYEERLQHDPARLHLLAK